MYMMFSSAQLQRHSLTTGMRLIVSRHKKKGKKKAAVSKFAYV